MENHSELLARENELILERDLWKGRFIKYLRKLEEKEDENRRLRVDNRRLTTMAEASCEALSIEVERRKDAEARANKAVVDDASCAARRSGTPEVIIPSIFPKPPVQQPSLQGGGDRVEGEAADQLMVPDGPGACTQASAAIPLTGPDATSTAGSAAPARVRQTRNARECPICDKSVLKLAQHLRRQHGVDPAKAKGLSSITERGPRTDKENRLRHHCTVKGCSGFVGDMARHMRMQHPDSARPSFTITASTPTPSSQIAPRSGTNLPTILRRFFDHLIRPSGGNTSAKNAKQCVAQVKKFSMDCGGEGLSAFSHESLRSYYDVEVEKIHAGTAVVGTLKAYLSSLKRFITFATMENIGLSDSATTELLVTNLSASLHKEVAERRSLRAITDETESIIPPEAREYFQTCPYKVACLKALEEPLPTPKEIADAEGVLMVLISISAGARASALVNMTVDQVQKAPLLQETSEHPCRVISVARHKTTGRHGPASIPVSPTLYKHLLTFIALTGVNGTDHVFRDKQGRDLTDRTSQASAFVRTAWQVSGAEKKFGKANITSFRKTITTSARTYEATSADSVAGLLAHNRSTADKFYSFTDKRKSAAEAYGVVQAAHTHNVVASSSATLKPDGTASDDSDNSEDLEDAETREALAIVRFPGLDECDSVEAVTALLPDTASTKLKVYKEAMPIKRSLSLKQSYVRVHDALATGFAARFNDANYEEYLDSVYGCTEIECHQERYTVMLLLTEVVSRALRCTVRCKDPPNVLLPYRESDSEVSVSDGEGDDFSVFREKQARRNEAETARLAKRAQEDDENNSSISTASFYNPNPIPSQTKRQKVVDTRCRWPEDETAMVTEAYRSTMDRYAKMGRAKIMLQDVRSNPVFPTLNRNAMQVRDKLAHIMKKERAKKN